MFKLSPLQKMWTGVFCVSQVLTVQAATDESLEKIEVLGSRIASSDSIDVIEIDQTEYQSMESVLAAQPEIQVNANSGPGSINEIYLRGADSNYTLAFFNGIPLNDSTNSRGGVADLSVVSPFMVDRVEIVTGAHSSIYGSQAVAGAIDFVSSTQSDLKDGQFRLRTAMDSEEGYEVGVAADFDGLSIKAMQNEAPETYEGSDFKNQSILIVAEPDVGDGSLKLTLWGNKADASSFPDDSGGADYAELRELESRDIEDINVAAKYVLPIDDKTLTIQGYSKYRSEDIDTPAIAPGIRDPQGYPASATDNTLKRSNITAFLQQRFQDVDVVVGADFTYESGESSGALDFGFFDVPTDFDKSRDIYGVFAEFNYAFLDDFELQLAGRYDDTDSDDVFTPTANLIWAASDAHQFSVEWGKGFKTPSFYALGHPLIGNKDLKDERSETLQVNYTYQHALGEFSVSAFDYEFTDLIDFEPGPPPMLVNRNKTTSEGYEIGFAANETENFWLWHVSYSYTDTETDGGQELLGRAKHSANGLLQKRFTSLDLTWKTQARYIGTMYGSSVPTDIQKMDANIDLSTSVNWQANDQISLSAGVNNLLDEDLEYTPGNRHVGTFGWVALDYTF